MAPRRSTALLLAGACLCALLSNAAAAVGGPSGPALDRPTTYTQLARAKGQWNITIEATKGSKSKSMFFPQVCSSPALSAACNQPLLSADHHDKVRVTAKLADGKLLAVNGMKPDGVVLRLCFSKPSTADRPWRKAADAIDRDRSCPHTVAKLPLAANGTYSGTFVIPAAMPRATWYAQVLATCKNGTVGPVFCQYDNTVNATYFGTDIIASTPGSLKVAVGVCSAIAPAFLLAFFLREQYFKKQA